MATQQSKQSDPKPADTKSEDTKGQETNPGVHTPEVYATQDTAVAEKAGITEGDVKALRDDAGLNRLAGHESDVHAWEQSPAGKAYKDGEKDRDKAAKAEEKSYNEQFNDDGLTEADAKYKQAVEA